MSNPEDEAPKPEATDESPDVSDCEIALEAAAAAGEDIEETIYYYDENAKITALKPHPRNASIYEDCPVSDLVESYALCGRMLEPIVVLEDYTIISGHRRWKAAKVAGWKTVPVIFAKFGSIADEIQAILEYNKHRKKTHSDMHREIEAQRKILKEKGIKGRTTEAIANELGMGSYREVERIDYVMKHAPRKIKEELDQNVITLSQAYKQAREIDTAPNKSKKAIHKKIESGVPVKQAINEVKSEDNAKLVEQQRLQGGGGPYGLIVAYLNLDYAEIGYIHPGPRKWDAHSDPVLSHEQACAFKIDGKTMDELIEDQSLCVLWIASELSGLAEDILRAWGFEWTAKKFYWARENRPEVSVPGPVGSQVMEGFIGTRGQFTKGYVNNFFIAEAPERALPAVFYAILKTVWDPESKLQIGGTNIPEGYEQYAALH